MSYRLVAPGRYRVAIKMGLNKKKKKTEVDLDDIVMRREGDESKQKKKTAEVQVSLAPLCWGIPSSVTDGMISRI